MKLKFFFFFQNFLPSNSIRSLISTNLLPLTSFNFGQIHETALSRFTILPEAESLPTARARSRTEGKSEGGREGI